MCKIRHLAFYILIPGLLAVTSCSKQMHRSARSSPVFYPSPPDSARIQFLYSYSSSSDLEGNASKFKTFVTGQEETLPIVKPYGIGIASDKIYIADAGIAGLQVLDLNKKTLDYFSPAGRGTLKVPINCFVDTGGDLYVSDVGRKQVVIFDENLDYKDEIGGVANFKPTDVVLLGDSILVTDPNNNRINVYDRKTLKQLNSFPVGAEVGDDKWLYNPLNLCVSEDRIYVTDFGDSRIKVFSLKGDYMGAFGSYGNGLAQFVRPKGIAVDMERNLYVVDAGFENVQIFNSEGQMLMFFGGPYKGPGDMYLPANVIIDYDHLSYFEKYVDPDFTLKYLILVTNQYGPDKISVYGRIEPKN